MSVRFRSHRAGIILSLCLCLVATLTSVVLGAEQKPSATQSGFSFIVCSDLHMTDNRAGEATATEKLEGLLKRVRAMKPQPDFILVTGDIHVEPFQQAVAKIKPQIPIHVTPGNHERRAFRDVLAKMYPNDFRGSDFYSFRHKGYLFVAMCDAADNGDHVGHLESEGIRPVGQGEWLKKQMADGKDHTILFAHIPPSPSGKLENTMFMATNDQTFLRDLIFTCKPKALFFGHLHQRMEFKIGDSSVYVLPSINWNFNNPRGFYLVKVNELQVTPTFVSLEKD